MIGRKIENPKKSATKKERITKLTEYIRAPGDSNEKCKYHNARGFIVDFPAGQTAEMIALSQEAHRSPDTINHYVLSWPVGEQPNSTQIEEAVSIFMNEIEMNNHQVVYGLHQDTDNLHLHIAINRVCPDTLRCKEINKGFDRIVAHRAAARIEHKQGWKPEKNALFHVLENGELAKRVAQKKQIPRSTQIDMEVRTGEKSAERIAMEKGLPIIQTATSWQELHEKLALTGMSYEKKGGGAVIFVDRIGIKASAIDRSVSLNKLQSRFGPFEEPQNKLSSLPSRKVEAIGQDQEIQSYIDARNKFQVEVAKERLAMNERHKLNLEKLKESQRNERENLLTGNWAGKGAALNALRQEIKKTQASRKKELQDFLQHERKLFQEKFPPFPCLDSWLLTQRNLESKVITPITIDKTLQELLYELFKSEMAQRKQALEEVKKREIETFNSRKEKWTKKKNIISKYHMNWEHRKKLMEQLKRREAVPMVAIRQKFAEEKKAILETRPYSTWTGFLEHHAGLGNDVALAILRAKDKAQPFTVMEPEVKALEASPGPPPKTPPQLPRKEQDRDFGRGGGGMSR